LPLSPLFFNSNQRNSVVATIIIIGPVAGVAYLLGELDALEREDGDKVKYPTEAALSLLVTLQDDEAKKRKYLLNSTPFRELLDAKWKSYGWYAFFLLFIMYLAFVVAISLSVIRPPPLMNGENRGTFLLLCDIYVLICGFVYSITEIIKGFPWNRQYFTDRGFFFPLPSGFIQ